MRRLARILLHAVARVSFGLCILLLAAWALSHVVAVGFWHRPLGDRRWIAGSSQRGVLLLDVGNYYRVSDPTWDRGGWWHEFLPGPLDAAPGWLGVRIETEHVPHSPHRSGNVIRMIRWFETRRVMIAYWPLVALTAVLPSVQLVRRKRAQRVRGSCQICGYDLRATPDRCPECGTIPAR